MSLFVFNPVEAVEEDALKIDPSEWDTKTQAGMVRSVCVCTPFLPYRTCSLLMVITAAVRRVVDRAHRECEQTESFDVQGNLAEMNGCIIDVLCIPLALH